VSEPSHSHHDHEGHDHEHERRPSGTWWRDPISNWSSYDAPFGTKARMAARNIGRRARLKPCCGHPGEPGC
jgi:hypothetical protein